MKKIYFNRKEFLFLYAYFRLLDLSLARSYTYNDCVDLNSYLNSKYSFDKIINLLKAKCISKYWGTRDQVNLYQKIKFLIRRKLGLNPYLYEYEIGFLIERLELLKNNLLIVNIELFLVYQRRDFCKVTYNSLEYQLSYKERLKAMSIEHFNQNETLKAIPLTEFQ